MVGQKADFLIPYGQSLEQLRAVGGRGSSYAIARLRDGVSFPQAASELRAIFADLEREFPQRNARRTVMLFPLQEQMVGEIRPALLALVAAVGLVLLVGCVNVANLLLARSAAREREIGLRTALGARRGRLVRQMLTESLVLAAGGGIAGLGVAALCHRGLLALVSNRIPIPRLDQMSMDLPVVAFTLAAALVTGITFGVVPAFVSTNHARDAIREGGRHGGGRRLHRVLRSLVVVEVALSLVLLAGAGLLMRSLVKLQSVDLGFRVDGVLTASVQLPTPRYDFLASGNLFRDAMARIAALPGVQSVAGASCMPIPFPCIGTSFWRIDQPRPADGQSPTSHVRPVTPGFFTTLSIPQIAGRDFSDADTADSTPVAIVSQEVVRRQFADGSPLGRRLRIGVEHANGREDIEWTIVGVVGDMRSTLDGPIQQTIFIPKTQRPGGAITFFVHTRQDPLCARVQRDQRRARDGTGSARQHPHARRGCRPHDRASARDLGARQRLRRRRARPRSGRRLRRHRVFRQRADPGDRRPHGPRRIRGVSVSDGAGPGVAPRADRHRHRTAGIGAAHPPARGIALRRRTARPDDVCRDVACAADHRHVCRLHSRAAQHAYGSRRRAPDSVASDDSVTIYEQPDSPVLEGQRANWRPAPK